MRAGTAAALLVLGGLTAAIHAGTQPSQVDVPAVLDRFDSGDWSVAAGVAMSPDQLESFQKAIREHAPGWIAAGAPATQPRRRLIVATFLLQILAGQEDPFVWQGGGQVSRYHVPLPAAALVEWTADMLKHDPPAAAERWWHLGAIALLERARGIEMLNLEIDRARGRFPAEDRWTLARAVSEEFDTWPEARDSRRFDPSPLILGRIRERYQEALARPSVRQEAELRLGYLELRLGRLDEAQTHFEKAGTPAEASLRYWLGLFQGQLFEQTKHWPEAVEAYQRAFDAAPYAQSAAIALADALVQAHRPTEAVAISSRTLTLRPVPFDPWVIYTLPDLRFWPRITTELRSALAAKPAVTQ